MEEGEVEGWEVEEWEVEEWEVEKVGGTRVEDLEAGEVGGGSGG